MESVGARPPRLFFTDRSRRLYPGEIAVAEEVAGGTLPELLDNDPEAGKATLGSSARRSGRCAGTGRPGSGKWHSSTVAGCRRTAPARPVGPHGEPVLIDIEGLMYFDVEVDHCWMRMRFEAHYPPLRIPGLDPVRMKYYRYTMHLDLVGGRCASPTGTSRTGGGCSTWPTVISSGRWPARPDPGS